MPQIENCTITPFYNSANILYAYFISANEGYILHDRDFDIVETNPVTNEELSRMAGYTSGRCSCMANYDWEVNEREFYAVLRNEVPENQIFGGGDNDHEVM